MSFEKESKSSGTRHKARECALQMLYAADIDKISSESLTDIYWKELGETGLDEKTRKFANKLVHGVLERLEVIDDRIRTRAEHWRIERMALVDRNILRMAVYELLHEDTPKNVVINEALEITRRFSNFEATQFVNGILDGIKYDLAKTADPDPTPNEKSHASSN